MYVCIFVIAERSRTRKEFKLCNANSSLYAIIIDLLIMLVDHEIILDSLKASCCTFGFCVLLRRLSLDDRLHPPRVLAS